ncbi:MAG TPA: dephospho-CoA kinase [Gaiellaceae bacterium]|nr:dephospho-CoA kinase [Gaiellaceae bacterium]
MPRPLAVAITGGIGAGKSEALRAFARHGAETISSDEIVHELLRSDREVRRALIKRFGPGIRDETGRLDRRRIADVVFSDREQLDWLEGLLHPRVVERYLNWRAELAARPDAPALCVTEVPLLYEVGGETRFDVVVVVTASPAAREARGRKPPDDREQRLIPDADKARRADYAYVNDGSLDDLDRWVAGVAAELSRRGS